VRSTQAFSGTDASWAACARSVCEVARSTSVTRTEAGKEQIAHASHLSYISFSGGWRLSVSLKSAGMKLDLAATHCLASRAECLHSPESVEIIPELPYLIDGPILRQRGEGIRDRAGVVVIERRLLAPQSDVDRQRDLLDRGEAVEPMRAHIARQIGKPPVRTAFTYRARV
jgi:hypothetical protein